MTHIVCLYKTDDGIIDVSHKPYALHPMCGKDDAETLGCGLMFQANYCPGNDYAVYSLPEGECLTPDADDSFLHHAQQVLEDTYGDFIEERYDGA